MKRCVGDSLGFNPNEQIEIARHCARKVALTARDLADYAGVDLLTGKPLLKGNN